MSSVQMYLKGTSLAHRLDPRAKLVALAVAFVVPLLFDDPLYTGAVLAVYLIGAVMVGATPNVRTLAPILISIQVAALVMWPIFVSGETPLFLWIEVESLLYGLAMGFRLLSMVVAGIILLTTTSIEHLVWGMVKLGLPYRIGFTITTAVRLVPMLISSTSTISDAQASRGLDLKSGNAIERARKHVPLIVPATMSAIRRANDFSIALEARAFSHTAKRTYHFRGGFGSREIAVLVLSLAALAVCLVLRVEGFGVMQGLQT